MFQFINAIPDHDPDVAVEIVRRLAECGRLTFAEVMEIALYHPTGGYYMAHVEIGPEGDFVTAPEEHPAFGALLARQAAQCWQAMGAPANFPVFEIGGGRGALAAAFLAHARAQLPEFAQALRYTLIDRSPRLIDMQRERLSTFADQVSWAEELPTNIEGLILSNELIDAFPVHRVIMRETLRELYVVARSTDPLVLDWEEGEPSTPQLTSYFAVQDIELAEGQHAEVNLAALGWMRATGEALARGFVITIDFGHLAKQLYRRERSDTLLAYYRQRVSSDLLAGLGRQDLIAHVNFTQLVEMGKTTGLLPLGLVTQQNFLLDLGIEGWLARFDMQSLLPGPRLANRRGLTALISTEENGLGDAKVLVQGRGLEARLDGLAPAARKPNARALQDVPMPLLDGSEA